VGEHLNLGDQMGKTTSVALIDDHQTLLDLLSFAIEAEDDLAVVGTATTAAEGQRLVERTRPDVVLLDFVLPDRDGLAVAAVLARDHPGTRVVMLTAAQDADLITRAAAVGAAGFVMKSGSLVQVLNTIRSARKGSMIVDPVFLAMLGRPDRRPADGSPPGPMLTPRELDVVELLGRGKDARTIARELSISLNTCRGYVKNALAKLDSHSQLEAVVKARQLGLLRGSDRIPAAG
jgi:DNA-binding NarL/FixJ family response regulator